MSRTQSSSARTAFLLVGGFAAISGCTASAPRPAPKPVAAATAPATAPATARAFPPQPPIPPEIRAALDRRLPEWKCENVPWSTALAQFQAELKIPMEIRWDQMGRPDSPLTLRVANVKASKVLRLICQDQSRPDRQLYDWVSTDDRPARLIVSTQADYLRSEVVDFTYDIADITAWLRGRFGGEEDLLVLIKEAVDPDSWVNGSRGYATVDLRQDNLVVHQTKVNQVALSNLLQQVREQQRR